MKPEITLGRSEEKLPPRSVVERKLEDLLAEKVTREIVSAWARPYALGDVAEHEDVTDIPSWEALTSLAMCDVKDPNDGGYLYNKASFRAWLEQLRAAPSKPSKK